MDSETVDTADLRACFDGGHQERWTLLVELLQDLLPSPFSERRASLASPTNKSTKIVLAWLAFHQIADPVGSWELLRYFASFKEDKS